jgi:hypothetical protein
LHQLVSLRLTPIPNQITSETSAAELQDLAVATIRRTATATFWRHSDVTGHRWQTEVHVMERCPWAASLAAARGNPYQEGATVDSHSHSANLADRIAIELRLLVILRVDDDGSPLPGLHDSVAMAAADHPGSHR